MVDKIKEHGEKISWVIITILLCFISAMIGRDTMTPQLQEIRNTTANLEKGRAINEIRISKLELMDTKIDAIRYMMEQHIAGEK